MGGPVAQLAARIGPHHLCGRVNARARCHHLLLQADVSIARDRFHCSRVVEHETGFTGTPTPPAPATPAACSSFAHVSQPVETPDNDTTVGHDGGGGESRKMLVFIAKQPAPVPHMPSHYATNCTPCRPLLRAVSGWILFPPPTSCPKSFSSSHLVS